MGLEQRDPAVIGRKASQPQSGRNMQENAKPFEISKYVVMDAWEKVRQNRGSAGIDGVTIEQYEANLKDNLYKLWNRMSSGSYMPKPVKQVLIPKKNGKMRPLGIPTVEDRVAQMVVKTYLEPACEQRFVEDSYGYRPAKSALDAVSAARKRCWKYDWVVEFDIVGLFDNIDHDLLFKAVDTVNDRKWVRLYLYRWCTAPVVDAQGDVHERTSGTSQGGVTSPLLANLFLHYAFDKWMEREFPFCPFERYADDAVVHCRTRGEAERLLAKLDARMRECRLQLHPDKTRIVYCKDKDRRGDYPVTQFDFLGYTFAPLFIVDRTGRGQVNFLARASKASCKSFRAKVKGMNLHSRAHSKIEMLAEDMNPMIRGWLQYFTKFCKSAVRQTMRYINERLVKWAMCKYKRFRGHKRRATKWLKELAEREPNMFAHWEYGWGP